MGVKSRREEYSEATRAALVDAARPLFTERGFAETSVDEIARAARVTKGALYHHFACKKELFEAVFHSLHERSLARVVERASAVDGAWQSLEAGFEAFLDECLDPEHRRIILQEGPAVLGWERWREIDERYASGLLRADLGKLMEEGVIDRQSIDLLVRVLLGAINEAAMTIANASDEARARAEAGELVLRLLRSLRR